jgi:succinate dehydrogenase/fumarate reductase-like Fe-S protein
MGTVCGLIYRMGNAVEEDTSFISLAAAMANVVQWLQSERDHRHQEDRERQTGRQREDEQQPENQVDGVEGDLNKRPAT